MAATGHEGEANKASPAHEATGERLSCFGRFRSFGTLWLDLFGKQRFVGAKGKVVAESETQEHKSVPTEILLGPAQADAELKPAHAALSESWQSSHERW